MKQADPFNNLIDTSGTYVSYVQAIQMIFRVHPIEAATWILSQSAPKFDRMIEEAVFIDGTPQRALSVVPDPAPSDDTQQAEATLKEMLLEAILPEGATFERISMQDIRRELAAEGGLPIQLMLRLGSPQSAAQNTSDGMILALHLADKTEDGSETPDLYIKKMGWEMQAFEYMIHQNFLNNDANPELFNWHFCPIYLWPGTGLKDPGDRYFEGPDMSVFGGVFAEKEAQRQERIARNLALKQTRMARMEERIAAAQAREALMGDAGITEAEIRQLYNALDVEKAHIAMAIGYPNLRLWETPVEQLAETLPVGAMGLALFGYRPAGFSDLDVLRQCLWRFRTLMQDLDDITYLKSLMTFFYCANVFLPREEIQHTMESFGLSWWDPF